nr:PD-(D/E)XK nuclease family protein [Halomarina salina]
MLDGNLEAIDPTTAGIPAAALDPPTGPQLRRQHSYTSLDTLSTCSRQHYLNYVLRAFDDPPSVGAPAMDGGTLSGSEASIREIGVLFHETAERAANRGVTTPDGWYEIADQLAAARGLEPALDEAQACIDRYFECEASDWEVLAAEREFTLEIEGFTVTGVIDAVCRRPDGEFVILDYKATTKKRSLDEDIQLPLYVLACEELFEQPIRTAGYAYVGDVGPAVETRTFSEEELQTARERIIDRLRAAEQSRYNQYTAGEHCQWCPHRSLGCSDEADIE